MEDRAHREKVAQHTDIQGRHLHETAQYRRITRHGVAMKLGQPPWTSTPIGLRNVKTCPGARCAALEFALRVTYLALAADHEAFDRQRLGAHRAVGVQTGGGDADLRTQAKLTAVGKTG